MNQEWKQLQANPVKAIGIALAVIGLAASFVLQHMNIFSFFEANTIHPYFFFVSRKVVRVLINDFCLLLIIHLWFSDKEITRLAWRVQLVDTLILLPAYLVLKLTIEGDSEISSPLLSQLHRMIINPTLMILIIPGVYFQRLKQSSNIS